MIHICFNLDSKYIMPCKVLIRQLDELTSDSITYHFIGIDKINMGTDNVCNFYPKPDLSYFNSENLTDYYYFSQAAMYRLLIPFMINTDRAIYMDIDTVVFTDIKELWDKEIDLAGAVIDPCNLYHGKRLGFKSPYYNSGMIVFNSKKIRETFTDYKDRILQAQNNYTLDLKDQDIFNIVFKDHITTLGYEWNIDVHNLKEKKETKETTEAKNKAFSNPSICHCMGKEKWWNYNGLKFGDYWDSYARELTPQNRKTCMTINGILIVRN